MHYVYIIQSLDNPDKIYVGFTKDVNTRIETHNSGGSIYTSRYKPWKLILYLAFESEINARSFEKYLKSGSGKSFLQNRFL